MKKFMILPILLIAATACFAGCTDKTDTRKADGSDAEYRVQTAPDGENGGGDDCGKCRLPRTDGDYEFRIPRGDRRKDRRPGNPRKPHERPPHGDVPPPVAPPDGGEVNG